MIEGLDGTTELVEINLGKGGVILPPKNDKVIIMDADTLVFGSCTKFEDQLPDFLIDSNALCDDEGYVLDVESAQADIREKLQYILDLVGGKWENLELHFTGNPYSFRYPLLAEAFPNNADMWYKARRKGKHKPPGLKEMKEWVVNTIGPEIRLAKIHQLWEADDAVVLRKKEEGDNGILVAVDKDVLKNTPGIHFNYYTSQKYGIDMKWEDEVTPREAIWHTFYQTIIGDKSDGVPGLKGIGPKKAARFIDKTMTPSEMWEGVLAAYNKHCDYGDPEEMAILNCRLIDMNQLIRKENGECEIKLWSPEILTEWDRMVEA